MADPRDAARAAAADAFRPVGEALDRSLAALGIRPAETVNAPDDPSAGDGTTLATIEVIEPDGRTTLVPNITAFSYSSDAQQVGDPFAVTVPDPRLRYVQGHKLSEGSRVTFSLSSPHVAGGAKTKKITGVLVHREV